mgnify:CR=1 FL=1
MEYYRKAHLFDICNFAKEDPFLVRAGDWVKHVPVTKAEYDQIRRDVENGTYKVKNLYATGLRTEVMIWELQLKTAGS